MAIQPFDFVLLATHAGRETGASWNRVSIQSNSKTLFAILITKISDWILKMLPAATILTLSALF